ncbi:ERAP1-like C-terminal domain-containing protein, partial [Candidatus Saccharibacteria bacterium]|nr:ERAP1-like C-terminal domain-containing protein [Candidatus Saccharibacteria bacterium]
RDGDDENVLRLRAILLALAFYAEDKAVLSSLAKMYETNYAELDAEIRNDILDAKIYLEPGVFDEYLEAYKATADPDIKYDLLFAMTIPKDKEALSRAMKLMENVEIVKAQDQFYLFLYLYRNPVVKAEVFDWLCEHWDYVKGLSGDKSLENYPRYTAMSVRTEEEFKKWREFFEPLASDPALTRAVEVGKNEITARLKLIASDEMAVKKWVSDYK